MESEGIEGNQPGFQNKYVCYSHKQRCSDYPVQTLDFEFKFTIWVPVDSNYSADSVANDKIDKIAAKWVKFKWEPYINWGKMSQNIAILCNLS